MRAKVDPEICTGCGPCVDLCPEVFEMDGEVAHVKVAMVPAEAEEDCRKAMEDCPTGAISIEE